jgi:predicted permease
VTPLPDLLTARIRPLLGILVAAAVLVLLVACANVATLLVGRALARGHDLAVRLALGATRLQLVRAALAESLVLAAASSVLGVGISIICLRLFAGVARGIVPRLQDVAVDLPVLAVTAGVAVVVTLLCGVAPALNAARGDFAPAFRETAATASRGARRVRATLVAAQIALSVVLLVGAGLVIRTVVRLLEQDAGIEPRGAVAARLVLSDATTFSAGDRLPFLTGLLARVRALPGVQAAGIGTALPPRSAPIQMGIRVVSDGHDEFRVLSLSSATPGYFAALGARLVRGRLIEERDLAGAEAVAVLSESAARHLSPSRDIVGRQLPFSLPAPGGKPKKATVVGIVRDIKYGGLDAPASGAIYVPWPDLPGSVSHLVVRSAQRPASLGPALQRLVRELDPSVPVPDVRSIEEEMANSIADRRLRLFPAIGFAVLAFTVALVGLSASVTRGVAERRRELAVRGALGAAPRRNLALILTHAARVMAAGVIVGLGVAAALGRTLAGILYGVTPYDPLTFAGVGVLVATAALGVCYLSARRALAIDLLQLLRSE